MSQVKVEDDRGDFGCVVLCVDAVGLAAEYGCYDVLEAEIAVGDRFQNEILVHVTF